MCDPPILLGAAKSLVKNMEVPAREEFIDNFGCCRTQTKCRKHGISSTHTPYFRSNHNSYIKIHLTHLYLTLTLIWD